MELFTTSRASCFRRCRREHKHKYEDLKRPVTSAPALNFGSVFHDGLEQWRLAIQEKNPEALSLALAAILAKWTALDGALDVFALVRAEEMMLGYHTRWYEHDTTAWEYVAVERQFATPLRNPDGGGVSRTFQLGGKLDAVVKMVNRFDVARFWTVESKTSGSDISPGSDYWKALRIDGQISTYYNGADALGFPAHGCIYDVAKKPTLKPYKATPEEERKYTQPKEAKPGKPCKECKTKALEDAKERGVRLLVRDVEYDPECEDCTPPRDAEPARLYSGQHEEDETPEQYRLRVRDAIASDPEAYFQRGEVVRLEADMEEANRDAWQTADEMRRCQNSNTWPRNPSSCKRYGRFCPFYNVCTGAASIDDPELFRDSTRHPELDEEKA